MPSVEPFLIVEGGQVVRSGMTTDWSFSAEPHPPYERPPLSKELLTGSGGSQSMTPDTMTIQFVAVAKVTDVPEGQALKVQVDDLQIALFKVDGAFYATEEICTHAYASLAEGYVDGDQVECPLHGACFSIKTGKALSAPATIDLITYPVFVKNDDILVGVPK